MDELSNAEAIPLFLALEIDLDYEFDASRYFDFARPESLSEVREAESWFESAGSYPPSPYMARLIIPKDLLAENVAMLPKSEDTELVDAVTMNSDIDMGPGLSTIAENFRGHDIPKAKTRSLVKASLSRGSTLMKPTASQLAKQNQPRCQKPLVQKFGRTVDNPCGNEIQAAKRQKLEGGGLRKVLDAKQQPDLVHKLPRKDGRSYNNSEHARLKITIPREPELETAQRAQRIRPKGTKAVREHMHTTIPTFKARPLNRKILEAPLPPRQKTTPQLPEFKEFHLKTSERAMQHIFNASSSMPTCNNSDNISLYDGGVTILSPDSRETRYASKCKVPNNYKRNSVLQISSVDSRGFRHQVPVLSHPEKPEVINEGSEIRPKFKARSLNRKILSSKGDMGIFRTEKREATIPMEFNFLTDKQLQNPPVELFGKLSLTSGLKQSNESLLRPPQPIRMYIKGSKENVTDSLQDEDQISHMEKETLQKLGEKQNGYHTGGRMGENKISSIFAQAAFRT